MPTVSSCAACSKPITGNRHALGLVLHGYGDVGMLDTFGAEEPAFELCETCGTELFVANPWLKPALEHLNINVGHRCIDGDVIFEPMASCKRDPDAHGWRKVHAVLPVIPGRPGERMGPRTRRGKLAHYGAFATAAEAQARMAELSAGKVAAKVCEMPVGNLSHYEQADPWSWPAWWQQANERWTPNES